MAAVDRQSGPQPREMAAGGISLCGGRFRRGTSAGDGEMLTEADPGLVIDAQRNRRGYNMRLAHAEPDRRSLDP